ncbi:Transcription factor Dp-2, partial [Dissophora ornata]
IEIITAHCNCNTTATITNNRSIGRDTLSKRKDTHRRSRVKDPIHSQGDSTWSRQSNKTLHIKGHPCRHQFSPNGKAMRRATVLRSPSKMDQLTESPTDFREPSSLRRPIAGTFRNRYDREERDMENDMEHCSERDDVREREYGDDDEDEEEEEEGLEDDDAAFGGQAKRQKLISSDSRQSFGGKSRNSKGEEGNEDDDGEEAGGSSMPSRAGSRKQSMDERLPTKSRKSRGIPAKKRPRRSSMMTSIGDAIDQIEEEAQAVSGVQSLAGRGLRIYAQRVCERVQARGLTTYIELVKELSPTPPGEIAANAPEDKKQENIRRRVYDALNVLEALEIISFDNKDIMWVGTDQSTVVRDVTMHQAAAAQGDPPPGDGGDEESEEPEDDDMDIEKLEKENEARALQNELEMAKLQDQLTRHVQVENLIKRNRRREAREEEREERRRRRKEEKRARAMAVDQDPSVADVGPQSASDPNEEAARRSERHRRRRSSRHSSKRPEGQEGEARSDGVEEGQEEEDEDARRRRKKDRRERRKLKLERVQFPLVAVRMSGYVSQSSDSESNITVVRRERHCESTGQDISLVEIQIPQQDELSVISDTEILGDLGFNTLTLDELEALVPHDLIDSIRYTVNSEEVQPRRQRSPRHQRRVPELTSTSDDSAMEVDGTTASRSVTVRGGFEREIVRAAIGVNYTSMA